MLGRGQPFGITAAWRLGWAAIKFVLEGLKGRLDHMAARGSAPHKKSKRDGTSI